MKKVLILFLALTLLLIVNPFKLNAIESDAYTIITNPGEDASTEMNISWHMDQGISGGQIIYTEKSDTEWAEATTSPGVCKASSVFDGMSSKTASGADVTENPNIQTCTANLTDLESDTEYMYQVGSSTMSSTHYFKTAGAEEFSFVWISDWHAYLPLPGRLINAMGMIDTALGIDPSVDMMYSTGDVAAWGGSYSFWKDMYTNDHYGNYLWASVNGNHDNMDRTNSKNSNQFFKSVNNFPLNGYSGEEGVCYYFKYNNVLFINLNTESLSDPAEVIKAQEWFCQVVESNPSQYIFVAQHYEWFNGINGASKSSGYDRWKALFDQYGVDLAMAGNNHIYVRSYPLYQGVVSTDSTKGTVYMQAPSADNERGQAMDATLSYNTDKIAYRFTEGGSTVGAILVTVNGQKVTTRLLDRTGTVLDTTEIPAKRSAIPMENLDKEAFEKSFAFHHSTLLDDAGMISCSGAGVGYVYRIEYLDEENNILATNPLKKKNQTSFGLSNISGMSAVSVKIYYKDATTVTIPIPISSEKFDLITNVRVENDAGTYKVTWDYSGSGLALNVWVYVDGVPFQEVSVSDLECVLTGVTNESIIDIRDSNTSPSSRHYAQYETFGDVNFDGVVNVSDVEAIQKHVTGITVLESGALRLADITQDGVVDMKDATYVHLYFSEYYETITKKKVTVTFVDYDGITLAEEDVLSGSSVEPPTIGILPGFQFVKWDKDLSYITSDLTVTMIVEALPTKLTIQGENTSQIGKIVNLTVKLDPIQTLQEVTWSVNDLELADIDEGVITCKKAGTLIVTATSKIDTSIIDTFEILIHDLTTLEGNVFVYSDTQATSITIDGIDYRIGGTIYSTIQAAIDATVAGGTITILPGTYNGDCMINKAINLVGLNDDIDPNGTLARSEEAILTGTVGITASDVTIRGLEFKYDTSQSGNYTGLVYVTGGANISNVEISYNIITSRGLASHTGIIRLGNSIADTTLENFVISYNKFTSISTNSVISNRYRDIGQAAESIRFRTTLKNLLISNNVTTGSIFGNCNLEMGTNGSATIANNTFGTATDHIIRFTTGSGNLILIGHTLTELINKVTTITVEVR